MTMELPRAYVVQPGEPPEWIDELEELRESLIGLCVPLAEVEHQMTVRLTELRSSAEDVVRERMDAETLERERVDALKNGAHDGAEVEAAPTTRLGLETWADFRDHTDENIDYLVGGLIPHGSLVFLASQPKAGKTWLALSLAVSVATGKQYLQQFDIPTAAPVLYLALEGHRTDYRTRLGCIARGHGVDPNSNALESLTIAYQPIGLDLMDPAWRDDLVAGVAETGARMVFVDVLRNGAPRLREDGKGSEDFAVIRAHLQPLLKAGVTVVLVHHFKKTNERTKNTSIGELMSGNGALFGSADLIIGITSQPKEWENLRVEFISRSGSPPAPFRVQTNGDRTGQYGGFRYIDALSLVTAPADSAAQKPIWLFAEKISTWIREQDRLVRVSEISREFSVASSTINEHEDDLATLGIEHVVNYENRSMSGYQSTNRN